MAISRMVEYIKKKIKAKKLREQMKRRGHKKLPLP